MDLTNFKFKFDQFQMDMMEEISKVVDEDVREKVRAEQVTFIDELDACISRLEDLEQDADDLSNACGAVRRALVDLQQPWD